MNELIQTFHIDYRLILAQMVNFGLVFVILWFFALKPLMKIMKQRQDTIEKGLRDAKRIEESMTKSKQMYEEKLQYARQEANKILEATQKECEFRRKEILGQAKTEVEKIIQEAKQQIETEKNNLVREAQKDLASIIQMALERILGKALTPEIDRKLIDKHLQELKF